MRFEFKEKTETTTVDYKNFYFQNLIIVHIIMNVILAGNLKVFSTVKGSV